MEVRCEWCIYLRSLVERYVYMYWPVRNSSNAHTVKSQQCLQPIPIDQIWRPQNRIHWKKRECIINYTNNLYYIQILVFRIQLLRIWCQKTEEHNRKWNVSGNSPSTYLSLSLSILYLSFCFYRFSFIGRTTDAILFDFPAFAVRIHWIKHSMRCVYIIYIFIKLSISEVLLIATEIFSALKCLLYVQHTPLYRFQILCATLPQKWLNSSRE